MARPGIMIYFDMQKPLSWLTDQEKGRLFDAILQYGQTGEEPDFDGMLAMAWSFIQPKLDKDQAEYDKTVLKRQYANWCRKLKQKGLPDVSFDEWLLLSDAQSEPMISHNSTWVHMHAHAPTCNHMQPHAATCTPTTTTTPTTATTPTTTATTTTNTTANTTSSTTTAAEEPDGAGAPKDDDEKMKMLMNEIRGMNLSQFQTDLLLNKLGVDMFINYAKRLRASIASGNDPGSHMSTILWWYAQDHGA